MELEHDQSSRASADFMYPKYPKLIIFDFDGVVADSETLACGIAADYASELRAPMQTAEGLELFKGKRVEDVAAIIAKRGGIIPQDFSSELLERTLKEFATRLIPVAGVRNFLESHAAISRCIASSSSRARLAASLDFIGLAGVFHNHVYSVEDVSRGKPFPDLFLFAAKTMKCEPAEALVIEDSVGGVTAGVAAGMRVVGLLAASHMKNDIGTTLLEAGATAVFWSYEELSGWMARQ